MVRRPSKYLRKEMTMNQDTTDVSLVKWALGGAALGALTMFLMDPDRGNRRRALAKDKAYSMATRTRTTQSS